MMPSDYELIHNHVSSRVKSFQSWLPVDLFKLSRELGVVEITNVPIDVDGYLAKRKDGRLVIRIRETSSPMRARFTIAHEIAHILIAQESGDSITSMKMRSYSRDNYEEKLANRIAAELLIPEEIVRSKLPRNSVSWKPLFDLKRMCMVSIESIRRRIQELALVRSVFVFGKFSHQNSNHCDEGKVFLNGFKYGLIDHRPIDEINRIAVDWKYNRQPSIVVVDRTGTTEVSMIAYKAKNGSFEAFGWHL